MDVTRRDFLAIVGTSGLTAGLARPGAAAVTLPDVRIPRALGDIGGVLAVPDGSGPFPGVVMIPGIMALNPFARHIVERLAQDGFAALAVNYFDHPDVPTEPMKRPGSQPDERVLGDLDAARDTLRAHPSVSGGPIAAWGYCLGGRFAMLWPTYQPGLVAAASFHGFPTNDILNLNTPTEPAGRVTPLRVPVIAFFGDADRFVPMTEVERYRRELERQGKDFEIHVYPGADHGWTAPGSPVYKADAAEDCWAKAVRFLKARIAARR